MADGPYSRRRLINRISALEDALAAGTVAQEMRLGKEVSRAAALLPASTTGALFTVAGGRVLITNILGEVATVMPATANSIKLIGAPTTGTAVDLCTATSVANKEAGSLISITGTLGDALAANNAGATPAMAKGIVANIGSISVNTSGTSATGTVKWKLWYIPLDSGATVTATAV